MRATCDSFSSRACRWPSWWRRHRDGGGDLSVEAPHRVTVIHRRDPLRASKVMQDKAMSSASISFVWNSEVVDIKDLDQGKVTSLVLRDTKTGEKSELAVDGVFIGIGRTPNTALFKGQLAMHDNGYLKTHRGSRPACLAFSPQGTCRITCIARRSPRPVQVAWRRLTRSVFLGTLHESHTKEHVEAGLIPPARAGLKPAPTFSRSNHRPALHRRRRTRQPGWRDGRLGRVELGFPPSNPAEAGHRRWCPHRRIRAGAMTCR